MINASLSFTSLLYTDGRLATLDNVSLRIDLKRLLFFISGASEIPPAGFAHRPEIYFEEDNCEQRLPHSSTCGPTLYLPLSLTDIQLFQRRMDIAICCGQGFGIA